MSQQVKLHRIIVFLLLPWGLAACFLVDKDCPREQYCINNQVYEIEGPGEWSGCDEYSIEDCANTSQVCREYKSHLSSKQRAGCFQDNITCEINMDATCDGDLLLTCHDSGFAQRKMDCTETGQVCKLFSYTSTDGGGDKMQSAICLYPDVSCDANHDSKCDNNLRYSCLGYGGLAYEQKDCALDDEICVEFESWGARCTSHCDGDTMECSSDDGKLVLSCVEGIWAPTERCGTHQKCYEIPMDSDSRAVCAEFPCGSKTVYESRCEGDTWLYACGGVTYNDICDQGCSEVQIDSDKTLIQCSHSHI